MERPELDALLDYTQDKIVVVDEAGTFTYLNQATERLLGFAPDELLGENAFEYIHPEDRNEVQALFEQVLTSDEAFTQANIEYRHRRKDGSWVYLDSRFSNLTDSELGGYVVSSREITDRVKAEQRRAETETQLEQIADKTTDVLWMFTADWEELLFVNPAFEDVYGGSVVGLKEDAASFLDYVHPDDRPAVTAAMERISGGTSVDMEYRVNPDHEYSRWVWVQGEPIFEDGEVARIVGFSRDITNRRRRERQLAVMDNLLRHNLRNDLNTILGSADLIAEHPEEAEERTALIRETGEELLETAEKQRKIIELLTDPVRPQTIDLVDVLARAVDEVTSDYPDAEIEANLPESLPARTLYEIEVAMEELIENAAKHANEAPNVRISGAVRDDEIVIEISDNCPPIPDYEYRVLTGEQEMGTVYHSTGLGLWLVYWVIDFSEGNIAFENGDSGNTITVSLPRGETGGA